ncbi:shikimate kinase [Winogradskyella sp. UBA3174]|uniref:shikimate kinase n=1 Tax=Winogradskyella sp. UBA3174 TaxID=1947785 RepID=UPI0025E3CCBA|nr:shikimate kinase [Winogradskyella sp. UBA3174]|tara:strand:+ start:19137 stop:19658 length:522 start_codon:yes stop_codon:yes gene_type:complete
MIVILMGYMGSGKSTISKELATVLNFSFLDLDDYIINKESASISELFKTKGEIYFRKKETAYLKELTSSKNNYVIALGGGTPCYGNNIELLVNNPNVVSFYLKLSIPSLAQRLFTEREKRPLISHLETEAMLLEFIGKHVFERVQYYTKANHTISTDNKSKQEVVEQIVMNLI